MTARGSSPRIRGKRGGVMRWRDTVGLIPAHTGKTWYGSPGKKNQRAHPRAYGENQFTFPSEQVQRGSSPRIRGKLRGLCVLRFRLGLIPAHTGKTPWPHDKQMPYRAHPRAYGENSSPKPLLALAVGSSPRIRGKPETGRSKHLFAGLIPAHTGKTHTSRLGCS